LAPLATFIEINLGKVNRLRLLLYLTTICSLVVLAACRQEGATLPTPRIQELLISPTAKEAAADPAATRATIDVYPAQNLEPTSIPTAYPVGSSIPTQEVCLYEYFFQPSPAACPNAESRASAAAEQPFERGTMVWLGTDDLILILFNDHSWLSVEDTWKEGQLESDPSIKPPADRYQPIRGFGKVWREAGDIRQQLGWALSPELGFDTIIQDQRSSEGIPEIIFVKFFNGMVAALTKRDNNSGDWVIASSP
jgi:hypothetical protein